MTKGQFLEQININLFCQNDQDRDRKRRWFYLMLEELIKGGKLNPHEIREKMDRDDRIEEIERKIAELIEERNKILEQV